MSTPQQRLEELGLSLPELAAPLASYLPVMRADNLLYISGQLSADENGIIKGRLGDNFDVENAQLAARNCALSILSQIANSANIELQDIQQVIKLSIFVASTPDFYSHHLVAKIFWVIKVNMPAPLLALQPCPLAPLLKLKPLCKLPLLLENKQ